MSDPLRGTGRTTNIVLKAVRNAIDNAGSPVLVRDHFDKLEAHAYAYDKVCRVLDVLYVGYERDWRAGTVTVSPRSPK